MLNRKLAPAQSAAAALLYKVDHAIADLRRGGKVLLRHEGASFVVQAAEALTPESVDWLRETTGGRVALVLTRRRAAALGLVPQPQSPGGTVALSVPDPCDAALLQHMADPTAEGEETLPLAAPALPPSAADAAVELTKLARLLPAVLMGPVGQRAAELSADGLPDVDASLVADYQATAARSLRRVSEANVPLADAENTKIVAFRPTDGGIEHLAIVIGEPDPAQPILIRLHSECFTGDLLGSLRCDCGDQLRGAIAEIAQTGSGILLYLAQEGRGIGLVNKLRAYRLQDAGFDTVDANEQLGFDADERVYLPAAEMLFQMGFSRVRLLTNNPEKVAALTRCGINVVERVPHVFPANGHNDRYLKTKATRSGHFL